MIEIEYEALTAYSASGSGGITVGGSATCSYQAASVPVSVSTVPERIFMARKSFKITKIAQVGEALVFIPDAGWRLVPKKVKAENHAGSSTDVRVYFGQGNATDENKVFAQAKVGDSNRLDTQIGDDSTPVKGLADEKIYAKGLTAGQAYTVEVSGYQEEIA